MRFKGLRLKRGIKKRCKTCDHYDYCERSTSKHVTDDWWWRFKNRKSYCEEWLYNNRETKLEVKK